MYSQGLGNDGKLKVGNGTGVKEKRERGKGGKGGEADKEERCGMDSLSQV